MTHQPQPENGRNDRTAGDSDKPTLNTCTDKMMEDEADEVHKRIMAKKRKQQKSQPWKQSNASGGKELDGDTDTGGG